MSKFLVSSIIIFVMLLTKAFFFSVEKEYATSFVGIVDAVSLGGFFLFGVYFFIKDFGRINFSQKAIKKTRRKFDTVSLFLLLATVAAIAMSFNLNLNKKSLHWDAIALYDARAKFLSDGMKFSDMPSLSRYDNLNKYYYLLYPPYTSVGHYFWYKINILSRLPVGVYYSIFLVFLVLLVFLVTEESVGMKVALLLALIVASNSSIFNIAIKEYTNLPYIVYLVGGTLLLYDYLKTKKLWALLFAIYLVGTSIWIRLLEPMWIAVSLAFGLVLYLNRKTTKKMLPFILLLSFSAFQFLSWTYFTKVIGRNPGYLNATPVTIIEPFVGIFTGWPLEVLFTVARAWGIPLFIYIVTLVAIFLRRKYVFESRGTLFLTLVLLLSILTYFVEFYFLSFQFDWWRIVSMSLDRSATFLIPISGYLLLQLIMSSRLFAKN